jgi:hypothetical protein
MDIQTLQKHALDFLKGIIGAMVASALIAGLNYIGAHIPEALQLVGTSAAAIATIKTT